MARGHAIVDGERIDAIAALVQAITIVAPSEEWHLAELHEAAASVLADLAVDGSTHARIDVCEGVPALIRLIRQGADEAKFQAARVLERLAVPYERAYNEERSIED